MVISFQLPAICEEMWHQAQPILHPVGLHGALMGLSPHILRTTPVPPRGGGGSLAGAGAVASHLKRTRRRQRRPRHRERFARGTSIMRAACCQGTELNGWTARLTQFTDLSSLSPTVPGLPRAHFPLAALISLPRRNSRLSTSI